MSGITKRQLDVYAFIAQFIAANGYSPSFEEIGCGVGLKSLSTIHKHVHNLQRKGYVAIDYKQGRSVSVVRKFTRKSCPACGRVA